MKRIFVSSLIAVCCLAGFSADAQMTIPCYENLPDFPVKVADGTLAIIGNLPGTLVHFGGVIGTSPSSRVFTYNHMDPSWTEIGSMPVPISIGNGAFMPDGRFAIPGGNMGAAFTGRTVLFDPDTNTFSETTACPDATAGYCVAPLSDGIIKIGGSFRDNFPQALDTVWKLNTDGVWEQLPSMEEGRVWASAVTWEGKVYVVGGLAADSRGKVVKHVNYYDTTTKKWYMTTVDPAGGTWGAQVWGQDGKIFVVGGVNEEGEINTTLRVYKCSDHTWQEYTDIHDYMYEEGIVDYRYASNGKCNYRITIGGYDGSNTKVTDVHGAKFVPYAYTSVSMKHAAMALGLLFDLRAKVVFEQDSNAPVRTLEFADLERTQSTWDTFPMFIILDIFGELYFLPSFSDFDYYSVDISLGDQEIQAIPVFEWPEVGGEPVSGLMFYAAMTNTCMDRLYGSLDYIEWGWQ